MVTPFLTQGSLNAGTCITILPEVPRSEQQAIHMLPYLIERTISLS